MNCPDQVGVDGAPSTLGGESLPAPSPAPAPWTLPELPDLAALLDLPPLPVLPTVDPTLLLKPITDLLGVFGTGALGAAPGGDPAVAHQQIAQVLEDGVGTLLRAAQSLDGSWLGQAATSAITAATRTAGESGVVAAQGTGMSVNLQAAAAVVAAGALELQGVVVKTTGLLSAAMPAIATPPGQIAALAIAAEGLAEGLAVVSATRAQLIAPTAQMTATGAPVSVTGVPGADGFGTAAKLLESVVPLVQAGAQFATSLLAGVAPGDGVPVTDPSTSDQPTSTTPVATTCPATCDKTTATNGATNTAATGTTAGTRPSGAAPVVKAASTVSSVPATPGVSAPAPAPLADCPTTTNASTVPAATTSSAAPQMTAVGADTAMPMAPLAATGARPSDTARPITVTPAATAPSDQPVEAEWLTRMTAESLDLDVALALGIGDQDLAGSA
ncbi:hypothetical protein [Gordonia hydrophobica]|uniref:Uncharacterized protein n=1 Tax=Gordonia hydrophobica TaxID=40516 RepID=A0ABZ2TWW7_9ACTN|nr:hypothetical protein [Gordonia hydrophobica]MBM7369357.1 hypothetical protein [Gordonia hydrophobica]